MVPGMGPAGVTGMRTSVKFGGPPGMKITWQLPGGGFNDPSAGLTVPNADYNFVQGQVYRLRVSEILPNFPGAAVLPDA